MPEQNTLVLETYAEALADALGRTARLDASFEEAIQLSQVLKAHPELPRLLEKPAIRDDEKKALLRTVFSGRLSPIMLNLGLLLVDKHRGGMWRAILNHFVDLIERRRGVFPARVETACDLSAGEQERLKGALEKFTGKRLRIRFLTDARLVGGVRFRYGDLMVDNTIRSYLSELRARLEKVKVH
jgi:F-type H+-transporting ATPase subunit delta